MIKKLVITLLFIAGLSFVLGEYLPWWSVALAAFTVSIFVNQPPIAAFFSGFLGVSLLWSGYALWIDQANEHLLSERIASLLPLQGDPILLLLFTGFIGGIVGGLAALSANYLVRRGKPVHDTQNYYRNKMR